MSTSFSRSKQNMNNDKAQMMDTIELLSSKQLMARRWNETNKRVRDRIDVSLGGALRLP